MSEWVSVFQASRMSRYRHEKYLRKLLRDGRVEARRVPRDTEGSSRRLSRRYVWEVNVASLRAWESMAREKWRPAYIGARARRAHRSGCECPFCVGEGLRKHLAFCMTEEMDACLRQEAERLQVSRAEIVRTAVACYLDGGDE